MLDQPIYNLTPSLNLIIVVCSQKDRACALLSQNMTCSDVGTFIVGITCTATRNVNAIIDNDDRSWRLTTGLVNGVRSDGDSSFKLIWHGWPFQLILVKLILVKLILVKLILVKLWINGICSHHHRRRHHLVSIHVSAAISYRINELYRRHRHPCDNSHLCHHYCYHNSLQLNCMVT